MDDMKYPETESSVLELKREIPKYDQIIKTIIGFSNQHGGKLIVGVANNGEIVGISEEEAVVAMESLSKSIYEASTPAILPLVYIQRIGEKTLLIIEVSSGGNKPYYRKSEGLEKGTYIRLGPNTLRANIELIEELKWQARGKSYDTLPIYQTSELDLNEKEIKHFIQERKERKKEKITRELLSSYYLICSEHSSTYATIAGILLFGKQPQHFLSEAFIICTHFKGKEGREAIATIDCTGTLFDQFQTAFNFIVSRLSRSFSIKGAKRQELLEIPEEAIRESLLNAIAHRNYHIPSSIKVAIYDNRIEIFSPGSFPAPLNLENLKLGISYIRNIAICKALREAGYIEKLGSGLPTIFKSYEERKLKEPAVIEGENFIKYILPREHAENTPVDTDSIFDLFNTATKITISDVIQHLRISRTSAGRKLDELIQQGKIEKVGKGRGCSYIRSKGPSNRSS